MLGKASHLKSGMAQNETAFRRASAGERLLTE